MNVKEHYLMLVMFARMHEYIQTITDTLKSRGIWTDDDEKAFSSAVHLDKKKLGLCMDLAKRDYLRLANGLEVATGLTD